MRIETKTTLAYRVRVLVFNADERATIRAAADIARRARDHVEEKTGILLLGLAHLEQFPTEYDIDAGIELTAERIAR